MKLALVALLDHHAANLAVKIAEDVVEAGTRRVTGNTSRIALEVGRGENGGAAAVIGWTGESQCLVSVSGKMGELKSLIVGRAQTRALMRARIGMKICISEAGE